MSRQQEKLADELEQYMRQEIVARALLSGLSSFAGIFAECRFTVQPDVIYLHWCEEKLGAFHSPQRFAEYTQGVMAAIKMPYRVAVVAEVKPQ